MVLECSGLMIARGVIVKRLWKVCILLKSAIISEYFNFNFNFNFNSKQDHSSETILINLVYYYLINSLNHNFLTCAKPEI